MARTRIPLSSEYVANEQKRKALDYSVAEIGLSVRTVNCLEEKGIFTVRDLLSSNRSDLLSISNFGETSLDEVYLALEKIGYS